MYALGYDTLTGKVATIRKGNMFIPICDDNADFQEFLKWNLQQATPLDLNSTIEPVKPASVRDLAKEITELKDRIAILENI